MSPLSRIARLLLLLHSLVNMALGAYSFINTEEYAAMTGMQGSEQTLQSIGKLSSLLHAPLYSQHTLSLHTHTHTSTYTSRTSSAPIPNSPIN